MPERAGMQARLIWLCALASLGSVALALVLQHGFGMQPCAWCVLQRLLYLLVAAFCLVALTVRRAPAGAIPALLLADLSASLGLAAAAYHQFVAARPGFCGVTLADRLLMATSLHEHLPWLMNPTALCDEANQPLLGVPFAVWSIALFAVLLMGVGLALVSAVRALAAQPRSTDVH